MGVSRWAYEPKVCDGDFCPGDCDYCRKASLIDTLRKEPMQGVSMNTGDQSAKADAGKLQLSMVPTDIIRNIAAIRMFGNAKYGSPDNWKIVEEQRYIDAAYRHWLAFIDDHESVDEESGMPHLWHLATNIAFICYMEAHKGE